MRSLAPWLLFVAAITGLAATSCKQQEEPKASKPLARAVPKYKLPNQFRMSDGCIVRVQSSMMKDNGTIYYYPMITVNSWSKNCSEGKDRYAESEIVEAKYK